MASIPISATWTDEVYQIENGDPGTGGVDGIANAPHRDLANRTEYLKDTLDALLADVARNTTHGPILPIRLARFPGVATADGRLTVNEASGSNGGTVSITAGSAITLSEEETAGVTCREATWTTADWTSPVLDVSSTYYLRARIDSGALQVYVAKGTDADAIPAGFKGTPNAGSGGGFDSTPIDVLLAKVVTGTAGSVPTVTELANRPQLRTSILRLNETVANAPPGTPGALAPITLNWARAPQYGLELRGVSNVMMNGDYWSSPQFAETATPINLVRVWLESASRYGAGLSYLYTDESTTSGAVSLAVTAQA